MRRMVLFARLAALAVVLLVVALFAGFQVVEQDEVRSGVRAWGVDLGGMTRDEARVALQSAATERMNRPLELVDGKRSWQLSAGDLGLMLDVDRVVDDAFDTGRDGFGPSRSALLWHLRREPHELGLDSIAVQGALLDAAVANLAADIARDRIDPSLTNDSTAGPTFIAGQTGRELDTEKTRDDILLALSTGGTPRRHRGPPRDPRRRIQRRARPAGQHLGRADRTGRRPGGLAADARADQLQPDRRATAGRAAGRD
jgi:hypothetical protein